MVSSGIYFTHVLNHSIGTYDIFQEIVSPRSGFIIPQHYIEWGWHDHIYLVYYMRLHEISHISLRSLLTNVHPPQSIVACSNCYEPKAKGLIYIDRLDMKLN